MPRHAIYVITSAAACWLCLASGIVNAGEFDGIWEGRIEPTSHCSGSGPIEFRIDNDRIEGRGRSITGVGGRSAWFEFGGRLVHGGKFEHVLMRGNDAGQVTGRLTGDRGQGTARIGQCAGGWQATRIAELEATEPPSDPAPKKRTRSAGKPIDALINRAAPDAEPPLLSVPSEIELYDQMAVIAGRVEDRSLIAEVSIAGVPVALNENGAFQATHPVAVGTREIVVSALDEWGNETIRRIRLTGATDQTARNEVDAEPPARHSADSPVFAIEPGAFHALVIGNDRYQNLQALNTAVSDVRAIGQLLSERYGFRVTALENATRHDIIQQLSALRFELGFADNLLIYYAGRGLVDPATERGYWMPVDADLEVPSNWLSIATLTDMLKAISARHISVVAVSLKNGTLERSALSELDTWENEQVWLERMLTKRSRTVLTSGNLAPIQDPKGAMHSVLATAVLKALQANDKAIDAQRLFFAIRARTANATNRVPNYADIRFAGHEGGDFVFIPH
jgi:hypothetical protein